MTIANILVPLNGNGSCHKGAEAAAHIAKMFDAHLTGLHVKLDPASAIPFIADGLTADIVQELVTSAEQESEKRAKAAKEIFTNACATQNIPITRQGLSRDGTTAEWLERIGVVSETVGRIARLADLTVVQKPDDDSDPLTATLLDDVLTRSGRAVLLVGPTLSDHIANNIVIAWNGSAEAARAVADAVPFLTRAENVTILTVGEIKEERPDGAALAHALRAHNIQAQLRHVEKAKSNVGECILSCAEELGANLLVLGAFSQSRWRELILGGVTRTIIDKVHIPVLMSH